MSSNFNYEKLHVGGQEKEPGLFFLPPHLQIFTCKFYDHIVWLLWKFTYRLIRPRQTYLVFILNLVKPLVTLISWNWREVGEKEKEPEPPTAVCTNCMKLDSALFPSQFRRLSMKIKYVCRGLISLYINFHNNRTMWSTNLHVKIGRWGGEERKPWTLFPFPPTAIDSFFFPPPPPHTIIHFMV